MKYQAGEHIAVHSDPIWRDRANFVFVAHQGTKDGENSLALGRTEASTMTPDTVKVRLSRQEADYLMSAAFLKAAQIEGVRDGASANQRCTSLTLPRDLAEQLREEFTEQLARVGFDEKYDLTPEGKLLEALIDRFHAD